MPSNQKWYFYLVLFAPAFGYFSFYNLGFQAIQALAYLSALLFVIFLSSKSRIQIPIFLYFYIAYAAYMYAWNIFNGYFEEKGMLKYLTNNYHVYSILLLIIIYNTTISSKTAKNFLTLIKILLIIAFAGALIQFFIPNWMVRPTGWAEGVGNIFTDRRPSIFTYVSDNDYGVSVLAYFSILLSTQIKQKKLRGLIVFSILIGLYALLTNTRYIMIGFVLVILQLFLGRKAKSLFSYVIYISIALLIVYFVFTDILNVDIQRLGEERLFVEGSIQESTRYGAYLNFLLFFPEAPFFGTGVHLTDEIAAASRALGSSQIHVGYFSHLVSYGVFGSVLLFAFWFGLAKDLYKKAKLTGYYGPLFAFLVFLWFNVTAVDFRLGYPGLIIAFVFSQFYYRRYVFQENIAKQKLKMVSPDNTNIL